MNHTYKNIARFIIACLDKVLQSLGQGFVAGFIALHDFSGALVHNYDMIIFVEYFHTE